MRESTELIESFIFCRRSPLNSQNSQQESSAKLGKFRKNQPKSLIFMIFLIFQSFLRISLFPVCYLVGSREVEEAPASARRAARVSPGTPRKPGTSLTLPEMICNHSWRQICLSASSRARNVLFKRKIIGNHRKPSKIIKNEHFWSGKNGSRFIVRGLGRSRVHIGNEKHGAIARSR